MLDNQKFATVLRGRRLATILRGQKLATTLRGRKLLPSCAAGSWLPSCETSTRSAAGILLMRKYTKESGARSAPEKSLGLFSSISQDFPTISGTQDKQCHVPPPLTIPTGLHELYMFLKVQKYMDNLCKCRSVVQGGS